MIKRLLILLPVLAAISSLLLAGWTGLARMGWPVPVVAPLLSHGPLMISGFLGTLIGVERAVAIQRPWAFAGPFLSAASAVMLLAGSLTAAAALVAASSLSLLIVYGTGILKHPAIHSVTMASGAVAWLAGNILWLLGQPVFHVVQWWIAFLILTVSGERLELSRLLRLSARSYLSFSLPIVGLFAGLVVGLFVPGPAFQGIGLCYLLLALWLFVNDVARRTIRQNGLPRYAAVCLLMGYAWLAAGGLAMAIVGEQFAGLLYDAIIHAFLVGFIISMIFAHAPIILPALLNRPVMYTPVLYLPVGVLQISILLRFASDIFLWASGRQWGGFLNAAAILLFIGVMVYVERLAPTDSGISMPVPDAKPTTET